MEGVRLNSLLFGVFFWGALASGLLAHPLAQQARAVEEQATLLRQRMDAGHGEMTWGQTMAADDMARLASAAAVVRQVLEPDDIDWDATRAAMMELAVAGNRVRMSLAVSTLDPEAQKLGQQLVSLVQDIDKGARSERDFQFEQQVAQTRPTFGFGVGLGSYWGPGTWGYPWRAYGFGAGFYPTFYRGRRCR